MRRLEEIYELRGELLVEGWMRVRKFFPGVRTPLFRGAGYKEGAVHSLKDGIAGNERSQWRKGDPQTWDTGYGIPFTRSLDSAGGLGVSRGGTGGVFGDLVLVVDRDKVARRFKIGPVLSPSIITLKHDASARAKQDGRIVGHLSGSDAVGTYGAKKMVEPELEERIFTKHLPAKYIEGIIAAGGPYYGIDDEGIMTFCKGFMRRRVDLLAEVLDLLKGQRPIVVLKSIEPKTDKTRKTPVLLKGIGPYVYH